MSSYPKLTDEVIDMIFSKLSSRLKIRRKCLSLGLRFGVDIRWICKEVGISHTTYYRWLRMGRSLFGKRCLTETEKRLRAFARGVEKQMREYSVPTKDTVSVEDSVPAADTVPKLDSLETFSSMSQTSPFVPGDKHENLFQTNSRDVSDIEQLTDQLTGGVRCVEFKVKDSLKNM